MPNRIMREGILDSPAVNALSESGEVFYRRLMSIVDDFGRYEAYPDVLRVKLFWRQADRWTVERVVSALREVSAQTITGCLPLVSVYEHNGKPYLQVENFGEPRAKRSKYPARAGCTQDDYRTIAACLPERSTNTNTNTNTNGFDPEVGFQCLWNSYPIKGRTSFRDSRTAYGENVRDQQTHDALMASILPGGKFALSEKWEKGFVRGLASWINDRAWETEDPEPAGAARPGEPVYRKFEVPK